jgi:hypothetical protein
LSSANIAGSALDSLVSGSRNQNNVSRNTPGQIAPILFDQILVSPDLLTRYTVASVGVFDQPIAQEGHVLGGNPSNTIDYASDHTPVVAELTPGNTPPVGVTPPVIVNTPTPLPRIRIIALLPNPRGDDPGHETLTLKNFGDQDVVLAGWILVDRAGNEFDLDGTLGANQELTITLPSGVLPLNNSGGDEITLFSDNGTQQDQVRYAGSEATEGTVLTFGG